MPKLDNDRPQREPPPVRPPTLPPDFPDVPQNPTPSCSRLLTPPGPPTRLQARRLLPSSPKLRGSRVPRRKSPAPGFTVSRREAPGARRTADVARDDPRNYSAAFVLKWDVTASNTGSMRSLNSDLRPYLS